MRQYMYIYIFFLHNMYLYVEWDLLESQVIVQPFQQWLAPRG